MRNNHPKTGGGFIGAEIRDARRQKGITLIELADEMGVGQSYLVRLEKGITILGTHYLTVKMKE